LYDYVRRRVAREGICVTRHVFYHLRTALRVRCRPDESLASLVPRHTQCEEWRRLAATAALRLPALRRPVWAFSGVAVFALGAAGALASVTRADHFHPEATVWLAGAAVLIAVLWLVTVPLAVHLPIHCRTIGDLTRTVAIANASALRVALGWGDAESWQTMRKIISDQVGIPPDEVTPEKEFVRDLGVD